MCSYQSEFPLFPPFLLCYKVTECCGPGDIVRICGTPQKQKSTGEKRQSYWKLGTQPASWHPIASNWLKGAWCLLPNIFPQLRTTQWRLSCIWYDPYCSFWLKSSFPAEDIVERENQREWWRVNGLSVGCQSEPRVRGRSSRPSLNESVGVIALRCCRCERRLHSIRPRRLWG